MADETSIMKTVTDLRTRLNEVKNWERLANLTAVHPNTMMRFAKGGNLTIDTINRLEHGIMHIEQAKKSIARSTALEHQMRLDAYQSGDCD
tara:strand:- start:712 stop:984 length:273 start_codon:yes stop_codon:yes gene_type:complete